jgi:hypothetical protein
LPRLRFSHGNRTIYAATTALGTLVIAAFGVFASCLGKEDTLFLMLFRMWMGCGIIALIIFMEWLMVLMIREP